MEVKKCERCEVDTASLKCEQCGDKSGQDPVFYCCQCSTMVHLGRLSRHKPAPVQEANVTEPVPEDEEDSFQEWQALENKMAEIGCAKLDMQEMLDMYKSNIKKKVTEIHQLMKKRALEIIARLGERHQTKLEELTDYCEKYKQLQASANKENNQASLDALKAAFPSPQILFKMDYTALVDAANKLDIQFMTEIPAAPEKEEQFMLEPPLKEGDIGREICLIPQSQLDNSSICWAQPNPQEQTYHTLRSISLKIRKTYLTDPVWLTYGESGTTPCVGELCFALFEKQWYRARVESITTRSKEINASVRFLDFGNAEMTMFKDILPFREDIAKDCPYQAIECCLLPEPSSKLPPEVKWMFVDNIKTRDCRAVLQHKMETEEAWRDLWYTTLYTVSHDGKKTCFNEILERKVIEGSKPKSQITCRDYRLTLAENQQQMGHGDQAAPASPGFCVVKAAVRPGATAPPSGQNRKQSTEKQTNQAAISQDAPMSEDRLNKAVPANVQPGSYPRMKEERVNQESSVSKSYVSSDVPPSDGGGDNNVSRSSVSANVQPGSYPKTKEEAMSQQNVESRSSVSVNVQPGSYPKTKEEAMSQQNVESRSSVSGEDVSRTEGSGIIRCQDVEKIDSPCVRRSEGRTDLVAAQNLTAETIDQVLSGSDDSNKTPTVAQHGTAEMAASVAEKEVSSQQKVDLNIKPSENLGAQTVVNISSPTVVSEVSAQADSHPHKGQHEHVKTEESQPVDVLTSTDSHDGQSQDSHVVAVNENVSQFTQAKATIMQCSEGVHNPDQNSQKMPEDDLVMDEGPDVIIEEDECVQINSVVVDEEGKLESVIISDDSGLDTVDGMIGISRNAVLQSLMAGKGNVPEVEEKSKDEEVMCESQEEVNEEKISNKMEQEDKGIPLSTNVEVDQDYVVTKSNFNENQTEIVEIQSTQDEAQKLPEKVDSEPASPPSGEVENSGKEIESSDVREEQILSPNEGKTRSLYGQAILQVVKEKETTPPKDSQTTPPKDTQTTPPNSTAVTNSDNNSVETEATPEMASSKESTSVEQSQGMKTEPVYLSAEVATTACSKENLNMADSIQSSKDHQFTVPLPQISPQDAAIIARGPIAMVTSQTPIEPLANTTNESGRMLSHHPNGDLSKVSPNDGITGVINGDAPSSNREDQRNEAATLMKNGDGGYKHGLSQKPSSVCMDVNRSKDNEWISNEVRGDTTMENTNSGATNGHHQTLESDITASGQTQQPISEGYPLAAGEPKVRGKRDAENVKGGRAGVHVDGQQKVEGKGKKQEQQSDKPQKPIPLNDIKTILENATRPVENAEFNAYIEGKLNNDGEFWLKFQHEGKAAEAFDWLEKLIKRECKSGHALRHDQLKRGKIMAAIHKGVWCRGILNDVLRDDMIRFYPFDYGTEIVLHRSKAWYLPAQYRIVRPQALRCSISCSSYRYFGESACQYFTTLTADKLLKVCVKGSHHTERGYITFVKLMDESNNTDIGQCIAQKFPLRHSSVPPAAGQGSRYHHHHHQGAPQKDQSAHSHHGRHSPIPNVGFIPDARGQLDTSSGIWYPYTTQASHVPPQGASNSSAVSNAQPIPVRSTAQSESSVALSSSPVSAYKPPQPPPSPPTFDPTVAPPIHQQIYFSHAWNKNQQYSYENTPPQAPHPTPEPGYHDNTSSETSTGQHVYDSSTMVTPAPVFDMQENCGYDESAWLENEVPSLPSNSSQPQTAARDQPNEHTSSNRERNRQKREKNKRRTDRHKKSGQPRSNRNSDSSNWRQ